MKFVCHPPGKKSIGIIKRDNKIISKSYQRAYSFVFKKAEGCYVWDCDNKRYLDFAAGIAVNSVGHKNREVIRSIKEQSKLGLHAAFGDFYAETPLRFCEELLSHTPKHLNNVFLSNSGTESVEAMYKAARWHTKKRYVIAFNNAFHGRTMGSLSLTNSNPLYKKNYSPFMPVKHSDYPNPYRFNGTKEECSLYCLDKLEKTIKPVKHNLAAIFLEPIQGEGGYIVPPKSFIKGVRDLCDRYNVLMCVDEVQSGCYRTGRFLAIENFSVKPDIVSLSKSIGGGVPLGATIANKGIFDWEPGSHSNTFGGNLLACAAGTAALQFMKKERLGDNARKTGNYMLKRLNKIKDNYEIIGDVRGIGLMIGIEIVKDKKSKTPATDERQRILCDCSAKGLLLLPCSKSTIRICPPLTLTKRQADTGLDIIEDCLENI